ncbi:aminomethyl-transferring glycine dehydrogenase subunit GcvPA [Natranaerofaba carboxydovora]|uniref:aminomethyl-transferring glycine dehydrogenase subunit GcvPA n=1 Tax=Natranaerofaba carboxydovora TaxID=2742683 RepID=UPI001F12ACC8|nr:aminomethyl-transferring glycine dehydrogenase subunit GcvPA [Natranaerofaba carboxydovora]UMZ74292.1 putative glycine dehydrogenase (decarboxylating) subunit 1 [Natranaerofaba carboxydovora]
MNTNYQSKKVYPYIPNSAPHLKSQLMEYLGINDIEELYESIPERLRYNEKLDIPQACDSEFELKKHVEGIISKNISSQDFISFLGGGTWNHYVPSVCETIMSRDEFLTTYNREAYLDKGKFQALFETQSMLGDMLEMDVVSLPTYDSSNAVAFACRMANRINKRTEIVVPKSIRPSKLSIIKNYCEPKISVKEVDFDFSTGLINLNQLKETVSENTAAVVIENPSYLGFIETQVEEISEIIHEYGGELIVSVDPLSLGTIAPPSSYGADIVCCELQPLGIPMQAGGGMAGVIATREEEKYVSEIPMMLYGIWTENERGMINFGNVAFEKTSYAKREEGRDYVGTQAVLHSIIAGVYLAVIGPKGLKEISQGIMERVKYAKNLLNKLNGVKVQFDNVSFKEFVLNFDGTGKKVDEINKELLDNQIIGGKSLKKDYPELGESSLICVTEVHTKKEIDELYSELNKIIYK